MSIPSFQAVSALPICLKILKNYRFLSRCFMGKGRGSIDRQTSGVLKPSHRRVFHKKVSLCEWGERRMKLAHIPVMKQAIICFMGEFHTWKMFSLAFITLILWDSKINSLQYRNGDSDLSLISQLGQTYFRQLIHWVAFVCPRAYIDH